jgi:hypothetical protein
MKAIKTKFKGPTNTRGSRIVASDEDGNSEERPARNSKYEGVKNSKRRPGK